MTSRSRQRRRSSRTAGASGSWKSPPAWGWPLAIALSVGLILVFLLTFLTHALLHLQDRRRYLRQLADTDALTGLNNRQGFDTAVDAYLDKVSKIGAVGVMIDIDDFKRINDLYSHDTGDEALRNLANDLREAFPAPAIVGRNGGSASSCRTARQRKPMSCCNGSARAT